MGELALHPDVFWELTYTEYERMAAGWKRRDLDKWRRARLTGRITPKEFPLPGDAKVEQLSAEATEDLWAELDKRDAAIL